MSEHSKRDDTLLGKPRTAILYDMDNSGKRPKDSLRILTNGHIYYREYLRKPKPGDWLEIKPTGLSTLSDRTNVQMGRVVAIHALRTSSNPMPEQSLKALARLRLKMRADPSSITSLTSYFELRSSCWLIEELEDGQFNCDCRKGFKGKNCCHELALSYKKERIEVLPHAEALKLGERRKRGRPKKINMERPREVRPVQVFSDGEGEEEVEVEEGEQIFLDEEPLSPAAQPFLHEVQPILPAAQPILPAAQPILPDVQPILPDILPDVQPILPAAQPILPVVQPILPDVQPILPAAQPILPVVQPILPAAQPNLHAAEPIPPAPRPIIPAAKPILPAAQPKKRGRCGDCTGCLASNCFNCKYCKNKSFKKACLLKTCLKKKPTSPAPPKGTRKRSKKTSSSSSASKASGSAKRKRQSPPSSANTSPVLKPASSRPRLTPSSPPNTPITRRVTRRTAGAK